MECSTALGIYISGQPSVSSFFSKRHTQRGVNEIAQISKTSKWIQKTLFSIDSQCYHSSTTMSHCDISLVNLIQQTFCDYNAKGRGWGSTECSACPWLVARCCICIILIQICRKMSQAVIYYNMLYYIFTIYL